jgi:phage terminase large subunit
LLWGLMHQISLLPKQWEVFNPDEGVDYDIKLYQGGFGAGKTFLGSLKGCKVLAAQPGATWLVGADSWERLKITTWETWQELLEDANIPYKANKTDHIIIIPGWDDARVIFKGIDDPFALRSVNGVGGHLEEASLLPESAYNEFLGRLRQSSPGIPIEVVLTTNPQATKGWLHQQFVDNAGVQTIRVRDREVKVSRRRVIASTLENRHVSDAFIAAMQATYDPELYNIVVLGQDGDYTRGLVSYNFSDLNRQETEYRPDQEIYLSCDFNVDPMSWVLAHRYNREYHFFDEIVIENTNINECIDEFVKRYPSHESGIIITGDASGNSRNVQNDKVGGTSYTQMLNRLEFHHHPSRRRVDVREKNPPPADRVAAWNSMMCNTNGVRRIFTNPRCKWLIHNLQNLKYKEGSSEIHEPTYNDIKKDAKMKFMKHIFDAASYLVEKYDPVIIQVHKTDTKPIVQKSYRKFYG